MSDIPYTDPTSGGRPYPTDKAVASASQAADEIRDIESLFAAIAQPNGIATLGPDGILLPEQQPSSGGGGGVPTSIQGGTP